MMTGNTLGILLIGLTLSACYHSEIETYALPPYGAIAQDSMGELNGDHQTPEIIVKKKSDYSETFLNGLRYLEGYEVFELIDSMIIINKTDTVYFPEYPAIGEHTVFTGIKDNLAISVTVKRINYTSVDYRIEMVEFGRTNHFQNGQADIHAGFFLGSESDEDENTGIAYFVNEFIDNKENDCFTSIRIGEEEGIGFCKLIKNCNGKIQDVRLDNFTTLRRK